MQGSIPWTQIHLLVILMRFILKSIKSTKKISKMEVGKMNKETKASTCMRYMFFALEISCVVGAILPTRIYM